MEKIRNLVFLFFLIVIVTNTTAQEAPIIRKGLIRAQATLSPSRMLAVNESYFYLHGNLEGYVSNKVSIAGEAYYSLGNLSGYYNTFDYNHSLFFGASWHFTKKNNDLYVGLQPGVSFTKLNVISNNIPDAHLGVNPLFSPILGYNFYAHKFFHFFLQSRLVIGEHNYDLHKNLSEFKFSAGLGFNLNTTQNK